MDSPSLTDHLVAWGTVFTALFTLALAAMALFAWHTARDTLNASKRASQAAVASADAARAANEQARLDSIARTRPYVFAEVGPGLASTGAWDLRIVNSGQSSARELTLDYDGWPENLDDVAESIHELFETPRTLPPGCSVRVMWRLEGNFDDGTNEAGLGRTGKITVAYTSDDPSNPRYKDSFDVMIDGAGLWPVPEEGPRADGLTGDAKKFYRLGQILIRRLGELSR